MPLGLAERLARKRGESPSLIWLVERVGLQADGRSERLSLLELVLVPRSEEDDAGMLEMRIEVSTRFERRVSGLNGLVRNSQVAANKYVHVLLRIHLQHGIFLSDE